MKNKKILAIGLCGAICLGIEGVTYASALASDTPKVSTSETGNTSSADILYQDTDGGQISTIFLQILCIQEISLIYSIRIFSTKLV